MNKGLTTGALLLLLAGAAQAELVVTEQALTFTEVATSGYRIAYATIEVPEGAAGVLKGADIQFTANCPTALGKLALAAASLWAELPGDWEPALDPASGMTGLFFPAEGQSAFHAEIGKLLMDWTGPQSAILVLAFECGEIDCECSPLAAAGELRISTLATEGQ